MAQQLLYSPLTDCVHITGGAATHDAIVWGPDPAEQARRRTANDPVLKVGTGLHGFEPGVGAEAVVAGSCPSTHPPR